MDFLKEFRSRSEYLKLYLPKSFIFYKVFLNGIEERNRKYYEEYMVNAFVKLNDIIQKKYKSKLIILIWPNADKKFLRKLKKNKVDVFCFQHIWK
jgi:hypothetical protein